MGAIELLRKYAAGARPAVQRKTAAEPPQDTAKASDGHGVGLPPQKASARIPVPGEKGWSEDTFKAWRAENPDVYPGLTYEGLSARYRQIYADAAAEAAKHEKGFLGADGLIEKARNILHFRRKGLDQKWVSEWAGQGRPAGMDPLQDMEWRMRQRAMSDIIGKGASNQYAEAAAAENMRREAVHGLTYNTVDTDKLFMEKLTGGETTEQLAQNAVDMMRSAGVSDADVRHWENNFDAAGRMGNMAGTTATTMLLHYTGALSGLRTAAQTARTMRGGRVLAPAMSALNRFVQAGKWFFPASSASHMAADAADDLGMQGTSDTLHAAGDFMYNVPKIEAVSGAAGEVFGQLMPGYLKAEQALNGAEAKLTGWIAGKAPGAVRGQVAKLLPKALLALPRDVVAGPGTMLGMNMYRMQSPDNEGFNPLYFFGYTAGLGSDAMVDSMKNTDAVGAVSIEDIAAGEREMAKTPEGRERVLDNYLSDITGRPIDEVHQAVAADPVGAAQQLYGVTREEAEQLYADNDGVLSEQHAQELVMSVLAHRADQQAAGRAMREAMPDYDFSAHSPEEAMAAFEQLDPVKRSAAMAVEYRNQVKQGTVLSDKAWSMLTQEDARSVLQSMVAAKTAQRYGSDNGTWGRLKDLVHLGWDRMTKSDEQMFSDILDDEGARANVWGYVNSTLMEGKTGDLDAGSERMLRLLVNATPREELERYAAMHLTDRDTGRLKTPEQMMSMAGSAEGMILPSKLVDAYSELIVAEGEKNPAYWKEFAPALAGGVKDGTGISENGMRIAGRILDKIDVDDMGKWTFDQLLDVARAYAPYAGGAGDKNMTPEAVDKLNAIQERLKSEIVGRMWEKPFEYLPRVAGLWLAAKGYGGTGEWLSDPFAFWTSAACLVGGALFLGGALLDGDDDDDETDAAGLMKRKKRQQELGDGFLYA